MPAGQHLMQKKLTWGNQTLGLQIFSIMLVEVGFRSRNDGNRETPFVTTCQGAGLKMPAQTQSTRLPLPQHAVRRARQFIVVQCDKARNLRTLTFIDYRSGKSTIDVMEVNNIGSYGSEKRAKPRACIAVVDHLLRQPYSLEAPAGCMIGKRRHELRKRGVSFLVGLDAAKQYDLMTSATKPRGLIQHDPL